MQSILQAHQIKSFWSLLRSGSCGARRRPPAPGWAAAEEAPPTRTCVWPAPPRAKQITSARTRTSSTARCPPPPCTRRCRTRVARRRSSTAREARTARRRSGDRLTQTHSSYTAAWSALRRWRTESLHFWGFTGQNWLYSSTQSSSAFPVFLFEADTVALDEPLLIVCFVSIYMLSTRSYPVFL